MRLFSPRPAHPLIDEGERQRVLAEVAAAEPVAALEHAGVWLRSLAEDGAPPFALRALLLRQVDDIAQRPARVLGREYLTMAHLSDEEEMRLWSASRGYWTQLGAAYNACLTDFSRSADRPEQQRVELTRIAVRLIRAYGARLKWDRFRYWPSSEALWQNMGRAYLYALDNGFAHREVSAYTGERQQTTVEGEYLRALVFQISAMDSLLPFEIEIAESLIARLTPAFSLQPEYAQGYPYCVDPEQRRAPARMSGKPERRESRFYFTAAGALPELTRLCQALERGERPAGAGFAGYRSPRILLPIMRHLAARWAAQPPRRLHSRYRDDTRLTVVAGVAEIHRALRGGRPAPDGARWMAENVSLGGLRVRLPMALQPQLRLGSVLGLYPEGGGMWIVGVVRRLIRHSDAEASAAVETLSRCATPAVVEGEGGGEVIVLDAVEEGETVRLLLGAPGHDPARRLHCRLLGANFALEPVELVESGVEFDLARYRIAGRP
jgi:hypothetical protein